MKKKMPKKNILLVVTGSIAAYKAPEIIRNCLKLGFNVKAIMSESATKFVTPLTLHTLTGQCESPYLENSHSSASMQHIELARWSDIILIAPATADTIAKLASGKADSLITATVLATNADIYLAPAMNKNMWQHELLQANLRKLRKARYHIILPATGSQACGDVGMGRMEDPQKIVQALLSNQNKGFFFRKNVLMTAGPTIEKIDPVRYISNFSSGKMGYALALEAYKRGANVAVITGPCHIEQHGGINYTEVESANEMYNCTISKIQEADIFIATAAVSDYRPATTSKIKIKKHKQAINLKLERNKDILQDVGLIKPDIFNVGFAAETNINESAIITKLQEKRCDMLIVNRVDEPGYGLNSDYNEVTIYTNDGKIKLELNLKSIIAKNIFNTMEEFIANNYLLTSN
ncbi:MAG: bifunctional phosphopantothenoylcysteine decarboxylase/phosphopantothenate--cysteine ligase CoaBC [Pseudomonadota bacterium]|nr:bifunctional phosphopantothenoylcysteine decarboxylase/phosphopantothenate--cysteine ligase CoaBC [Pseudomonadota bacterium]